MNFDQAFLDFDVVIFYIASGHSKSNALNRIFLTQQSIILKSKE
jgi:hypothetical protein